MRFYTGDNINLRIEPYELCPCGSKTKFKYCCYQKARKVRDEGYKSPEMSEKRMNHEILKAWESTDFKTCFAFDNTECSKDIIGAHSIQNNRILNRISKNNHVYRIVGKISNEAPDAHFKIISKNKASTFFGFCGSHDTELFKPIELKEYTNNPEQNFLFAFRAHSLEHHNKLRAIEVQRNIIKMNPSFLLNDGGVYTYRVAELDVADNQKDYEIFKTDFENQDYSMINTFYRRLNHEVSFAASSAFAVKDDLKGNQINEIYGSLVGHMPSIYLNVYPVDGGTNIIISYHNENEKVYKEFFNQLESLTDDQLTKYLNFLIIEYTENIFFNPDLIENLDEEKKKSLLESFQSSIFINKKSDLISSNSYYNFDLFKKGTL